MMFYLLITTPTTDEIKKEHCIITSAATGQIVGELIESLGVKFTREIALLFTRPF